MKKHVIVPTLVGAFLTSFSGLAQTGILSNGSLCGCPDVTARDTVWVTDNEGAGVGSATWSCDHLYVLTEQVFVNAEDTLTIEPGTIVLGMEGEGRVETDNSTNYGVGSVRDVEYTTYPGALVVARGGFGGGSMPRKIGTKGSMPAGVNSTVGLSGIRLLLDLIACGATPTALAMSVFPAKKSRNR